MSNFEVVETENGHLVKMWSKGVPFEANTIAQLKKTASMPFLFKHLAAMPDAHLGVGSTIGTVFPTQGAVCPATCGVDIGCGMIAQQTTLRRTSEHRWVALGISLPVVYWEFILVDEHRSDVFRFVHCRGQHSGFSKFARRSVVPSKLTAKDVHEVPKRCVVFVKFFY